MMENIITLKVKNGWKAYLFAGGIIGLFCVGFMIWQFLSYKEYMGALGYGLMAFFAVLSLVFIINILYALRHNVDFRNESVVLKGVFRDREIPYQKLKKVQISDSYFKGGTHHYLQGTNNFLHLDFKYSNKEAAIEFLNKMAEDREDVQFTITGS